LRYIREEALERGYAVSLITLDSKSSVRFNRMDQILGATVREIEVPGCGQKGPASIFQALLEAMTSPAPDPQSKGALDALSNMGRWDYSTRLRSPALFVGLRAWIVGKLYDEHGTIPPEVEAWLCEPWQYHSRTKWLYERFVARLRKHFRDPRAAWQFYGRCVDTFRFERAEYRQSWDALDDLNDLARLCGLKGLVLLVDEFEDVVYNLRNIRYQTEAFWNLFRLFSGERFSGLSFYAVTPGI